MNYRETALTKLINLYYHFNIGYQAGLSKDLDEFVLTDAELSSLILLLNEVKEH